MYKFNSTGESNDPCGTPCLSLRYVESWPPHSANVFLPTRQLVYPSFFDWIFESRISSSRTSCQSQMLLVRSRVTRMVFFLVETFT